MLADVIRIENDHNFEIMRIAQLCSKSERTLCVFSNRYQILGFQPQTWATFSSQSIPALKN